MISMRVSTALAVLIGTFGVALLSQQEPNPNRLFVRVQTQLLPQPSATATAQTPILRPGTLVTAVADAPQSGGLVQVTTDGGQKGWLPATAVRPLAVLEAEQQLEAFGGVEGVRPMDRTRATRAAQCRPFSSCPMMGCATAPTHQLTNRRKRAVPNAKAPIKLLTFDDFDLLQALTDSKGIPQGEHLTAAQRKQLTNFKIGTHTISEGDHVPLTGFIAEDRTIRCGGAESVNCAHSEPADGDPACTRTDIHVPLVERVNGHEVQSVVTEPIPQGPNVKLWTQTAFTAVKKQGRRLLIRGGLFYDSGHIVNTDENSTLREPKRFTLWEIHPITAVLVCNRPNGKCDPDTATDWIPLK